MKTPPIFLPLVVALGGGCSTWHTTADLDQIPMPTDSSTTFDVWGAGDHWKLRALRIDTDSVRGIPVDRPLPCDSCLVAVPRGAVDSIRSETRDTTEMGIVVLVSAILTFPIYFIMMLPRA